MVFNRVQSINKCYFYYFLGLFLLIQTNASSSVSNQANKDNELKIHLEGESQKFVFTQECDSIIPIEGNSFSFYLEENYEDWVLIRYRLVPFDLDWTEWGERHGQAYFNLPDGQYVFQIQASDGDEYEFHIKIKNSFLTKTVIGYSVIGFISIIGFIIMVLFYKQKLQRATRQVELKLKKEYRMKFKAGEDKSGELANAVKSQGRVRSRKYQKVTVLFADIQGFTRIVEHINPEKLIDELDRFFIYFDEVVEKYHIEKIKTIGDAYMCAGGLPNKNRTNPIEVVLAGLEMQWYMEESKKKHTGEYGFWELRVGIHTGPVISGEIGRKNVSFDIWGDTVNIASRMESSGTAGMINITGITYQLVKEFFICEYRGKMPIKYKGETDMYYVRRIKPELSDDDEGVVANKKFFIKLQHIRFGDLEEYILNKLETELLDELHYHNKAHTQDVLTQIEIIARGENVTDEDLLLLKTAALLHDVGFIFEYENHEENSITFAKEILPKYNYKDYQVQQVVELIDVTRVGKKPRNFMEKIMKDADLDYLGRADFIPVSESLYRELNVYNGKMDLDEWNKKQYEFISTHTYYTNTARNLRQVNKERQLQKLKELIEL